MAGVGIGRGTLAELWDQKVGIGDDPSPAAAALQRIGIAVAALIDENNVRIAQQLEAAGVRLKPND